MERKEFSPSVTGCGALKRPPRISAPCGRLAIDCSMTGTQARLTVKRTAAVANIATIRPVTKRRPIQSNAYCATPPKVSGCQALNGSPFIRPWRAGLLLRHGLRLLLLAGRRDDAHR